MKQTVVFFSSCALDSAGKPDPFFLQELPWLLRHFDRVVLCSYYGVAEVKEPAPTRIEVTRPKLGELRGKLRAPLMSELWRELNHLRRDGMLTPTNAAKLLLFAARAQMLRYWTESLLRADEQTTLYSYWMSYDGCAAALLKKRHPEMRAVCRGHAFDVDAERNAMNPYLMKKMMVNTFDGLYLISHDAANRLAKCVELPQDKLHIVGMGSAGDEATKRFSSPMEKDGVLRVVSCAALLPIKQVPLLIDALAMWHACDVRWTHIGGGADEAEVRAYAAQKLGDRPHIEYDFKGTVPKERVEQIYAVQPFDVFVNTSRSEGVPVSIMEAMRVGLPIVAPNVGGIPELVDDAVGCLYQPTEGAEGVLHALESIASLLPQQMEQMRAASQARWNERCRSERLLPLVFPEQAKEVERA